MANELQASYDTGFTLYVLVFNAAGQVWQLTTNTFVAYVAANIDNYDIVMPEIATASGEYRGTFDSDIAVGIYSVVLFEQAGGSPVVANDQRIGVPGKMIWDGSAEIELDDIEAYVDKIDDATDGLTAIKAEVEGIGGITPATAANVATELATYDGPTKAEMDSGHDLLATEVKQDIISSAVGILLDRLTANRAGYLDELASGGIPADVDSLLTRLSADRAGYLDELAAINLPADIDAIKGYTDQVEEYTDTLEDTLATILAKTNLITTGQINIASPVAADGDITIVQGDDYIIANGTELEWTSEDWTSPDLTDATAELRFISKENYDAGIQTAALKVTPTITWAGSGNDAIFDAELTAAQTAALSSPTPPNDKYSYVYQLQVTTSAGKKITVALGSVYVKQEIT